MLFIGLGALAVFKKMLVKLNETSSPDVMNMVQKLTSDNCSAFNENITLFTLPDAAADTTILSKELHLHNAVINNIKILDKSDKWCQLQFHETCYIKKLAPEINFCLKGSKVLQLFE